MMIMNDMRKLKKRHAATLKKMASEMERNEKQLEEETEAKYEAMDELKKYKSVQTSYDSQISGTCTHIYTIQYDRSSTRQISTI